jgi:Nup53/35/40-type RNA recognition motif
MATGTGTPFVFPGSSARNRERNASLDLGGPSSSGKRSSSDNDETANLPENPWLQRSRHEPLATVQQNQQRSSLFESSPTGSQNYSSVSSFSSPPPNSILRNRKTSRYNNTETRAAAANSLAVIEEPVKTAVGSTSLVLPPTASLTYETARGYGPSTTAALSSKDERGDSVVGIGMCGWCSFCMFFLFQLLRVSLSLNFRISTYFQASMAPYSYDNLPPSRKNTISNAETANSTWILVYGYRTPEQLREIRQLFGTFGEIVQQILIDGDDASWELEQSNDAHRSTRGNWVALQYATLLQAIKALGHAHECLSDGTTYIGVKALDVSDPILWNRKTASTHSAAGTIGDVPVQSSWGRSGHVDGATVGGPVAGNGRVDAALAKQDEIFVHHPPNVPLHRQPRVKRSVCEHVLRYLLAIPE